MRQVEPITSASWSPNPSNPDALNPNLQRRNREADDEPHGAKRAGFKRSSGPAESWEMMNDE